MSASSSSGPRGSSAAMVRIPLVGALNWLISLRLLVSWSSYLKLSMVNTEEFGGLRNKQDMMVREYSCVAAVNFSGIQKFVVYCS